MRFIAIIVCTVVGFGCVASLAFTSGYQDGRHDGWWANEFGESMYGTLEAENRAACKKIGMLPAGHGLCIKP